MTERICQRDGCQRAVTSTHAKARYCSNACKSAAWRAKAGYRLVGTREVCQTPELDRALRRGGPSGRQVSYRKAIRVFAHLLWLIVRDPELVAVLRNGGPGLCHVLVESELSEALPERQRTRGTHPATTSGP